jgi:hypothetical protein
MIKLNQQLQQLEVSKINIQNEIVFNYFNQKVAKEDYQNTFLKAVYIGVLALMEDRFSAFLSKTQNELGVELENLKRLFDFKNELFYTSTAKGTIAEDEIATFLNGYFQDKKIKDDAFTTGNEAGVLPKNKTGDIVIHLDGKEDLRIVLECKFDKSIKLGDIASKDVFIKKSDTAWSQLIESNANRHGKVSIIVFDRSLVDKSILTFTEHVGFIPGVGFICIVDSQRGDYSNLVIAYNLSRDIAINNKNEEVDLNTLSIIVKRLLRTIDDFKSIKSLVEKNIDTNQKILAQLEKSYMLMEFNQEYLLKFLKDGALSNKDLMDFYMAENVKDRFKLIEKEIIK